MLPLLLALGLPGSPALAADDWPRLSLPPSSQSKDLANDAALVIAIDGYEKLPAVPGARATGEEWAAYLKARGATPVTTLFDSDATREEILDAAAVVGGRVKPGGKAWLVFIGHGIPGKDAGGALVAADARGTASSLEANSVMQSELLAALSGASRRKVVAVVDACFSGTSAYGSLTPDALQWAVPQDTRSAVPSSATLLLAAGEAQYAGPLPGLGRPAFSWLVLGALRGWGDRDRSGTVTAQEAVDWAADVMAERVRGRRQEPQAIGTVDLGLAAAKERAPELAAAAPAAPRVLPVTSSPAPPAAAPVAVPEADRGPEIPRHFEWSEVRGAVDSRTTTMLLPAMADGSGLRYTISKERAEFRMGWQDEGRRHSVYYAITRFSDEAPFTGVVYAGVEIASSTAETLELAYAHSWNESPGAWTVVSDGGRQFMVFYVDLPSDSGGSNLAAIVNYVGSAADDFELAIRSDDVQ